MSGRMKCPDPRWFDRLAKGKVTPDQERKLSRHLEICKTCRSRLEQLNDISRLVSDTVAPPQDTVIGKSDTENLKRQMDQIKQNGPSVGDGKSTGFLDVTPWLSSATGDHLATLDEFELVELVGRGGMGVVFKCWDTQLERFVALKLMSPQLLVDESASERFLREARSAAKINHPNVVSVYGVGDTKGLPYLVMEFVEGESLESKLEAPNTFSEVLNLSVQILNGLAAAHQHNVLHRDIKPANVILDRNSNQAKITDFGLACSVEGSNLTRTGLLVGTPEYLAPEQALGARSDVRSDLFSVGVVMYAMCQGASPFSSSSMMMTLDRIRTHEPRLLNELNDQVPKWFAQVVKKLIDKDPNERYSSTHEVIQALENETRPVKKISPTAAVPTARFPWKVQWNGMTATIALFGLGLLVVIATGFYSGILGTKKTRLSRVAVGDSDRYGTGDKEQYPNNGEDKHGEESSDSSLADEGETQVETQLEDGRALFEVRSFEELVTATTQDFDKITITIDVDEIDLERPIEIAGKDVLIRSDEETRLIIDPAANDRDTMIRISDGALAIEGIRIEACTAEDENDGAEPLIECVDSTFLSDSLFFLCFTTRPAIGLEKSDGKMVNTCIVNRGPGLVWSPANLETEFGFREVAFVTPIGLVVRQSSQSKLSFEDTTFIGNVGIQLDWRTFENRRLSIESDSCLFAIRDSLLTANRIRTPLSDRDEVVDAALPFDCQNSVVPPEFLFAENESLEEDLILETRNGDRFGNRFLDESVFEDFDFDDFHWRQFQDSKSIPRILNRYKDFGVDFDSVFSD